jgi:hypothetical protein
MKSLLTLLAIVLLSVAATACGAGKGAGSPSQVSSNAAASSGTPAAGADNDNDPKGRIDDINDSAVFNSGHAASVADKQAVTVLIKRYYAAALAGDGAAACSMINSTLVKAIPEDYGRGGPPYLRSGKTCTAILMLVFKHVHHLLIAEVPRLEVTRVRLLGNNLALAVLGFKGMPEREISVGREGGAWKMYSLLDDELP